MADRGTGARTAWMVAVLVTAVAWLAALDLVLVTREILRHWPEAAILARVMLRAGVLIAREVAPFVAVWMLVSLAAPALAASLATIRRADARRTVNHV